MVPNFKNGHISYGHDSEMVCKLNWCKLNCKISERPIVSKE